MADADLEMLNSLLEGHLEELSDVEVEAFADMRFCLKMGHYSNLSVKQRGWVVSTYERLVPQYENMVSRGLVPQGTPSPESRALDEMLAKPKVLRPPTKRKDGE